MCQGEVTRSSYFPQHLLQIQMNSDGEFVQFRRKL